MKSESAKSGDDAQNVAFFHDQQFFTVQSDLGTGPFAEQNLVASFDVHRDAVTVVVTRTGANCNDFTLGGFFLGIVGDDKTTRGLLVALNASDNYASV